MEYSEEEQRKIFSYWSSIYPNNDILINANTYCELNGFGRAYLKRKLEQGHLQTSIQDYFKNFPKYEIDNTGLFIFGGFNTGKTIATTVLAKNIVMKKNPLLLGEFSCKFFLYDDLVRLALDGNFSTLEPIIKRTDILVLDNIGNETGLRTQAKSSVSLLENILRNREMRDKLTWITTNIDLDKISSIYNEVIASIIKRTSKLISSSIF